MEKAELLYEGKAKKVYAMSEPGYCLVEYKDDATAFNGLKRVPSPVRVLSTTECPISCSSCWRVRVSRPIL